MDAVSVAGTAATTLPVRVDQSQGVDNMPSAISVMPLNASPFLLRVGDVEALAQSEGFSILRRHLAQHYTFDLCDSHCAAEAENLERWLMVRDVLHALLVPIVELFDKACAVASHVTNATRLEDLEYAFTDNARSAFVWLQCFLSSDREREWCYTKGCPACVVDHSLESEFSIRLLYAACLLSDVHYPFTLEGPTLPSFIFFLDTLERALHQDPLYKDDFFELMQPKALATRNGIEDLIKQCLELDAIISQPTSPISSDSEMTSPVLGPSPALPLMKIKRSKMARRQLKLKMEEEHWKEELRRRLATEKMVQVKSKEVSTVSVTEVEVEVA